VSRFAPILSPKVQQDIPVRLLLPVAGASLFLLAVACSNNSSVGPQQVVRVRVVPESVSVAAGDTVRVAAFPVDLDSAWLPNKPVDWLSETAGVATVDGAGLITGVASGSTMVDATSDGVVGKVIVVVP
jgi:uncharacterized protein YjdB